MSPVLESYKSDHGGTAMVAMTEFYHSLKGGVVPLKVGSLVDWLDGTMLVSPSIRLSLNTSNVWLTSDTPDDTVVSVVYVRDGLDVSDWVTKELPDGDSLSEVAYNILI